MVAIIKYILTERIKRMDKDFKILNELQRKNKEYYRKFESLLKVYEPFLNSGAPIRDIGFTPHDVENHCANIYRILSDILPKSFYQKYSYGENLYLLIIGVLLHDYAMATKLDEESRRRHSEIGKELVLEQIYSNETTVMQANIPRDFAEALGDIIYAHSDIKDENNEIEKHTLKEVVKKYNEIGLSKGKNEQLNVPYLAAVLRLADELDLDYNRVNKTGYEKKYNTEESKLHFQRCKYFKKVQVDPKNEKILLLEVDSHVFNGLDDAEKQTASAQIINTYEKVCYEFEQMKDSILFSTLYASDKIWNIESVKLLSEERYRVYLEKKKN